jgi:hypothetical protein
MESVRWSGSQSSFLAQSSGSAGLVFITASSDPPETLLRLRGDLVCVLDGVQAPGTLISVGIGIALVPEGSSTTVLWSPLSDSDAPWWYYERFTLGYEEYVTDVIDSPGLSSVRKTVDLKGMRIIRPDVEAQVVVENLTIGSAGAFNLSLQARVER